MANLTVYGKLRGAVTPPASKSITHRYLICAALADRKTVIRDFCDSMDTRATISCLKSLGAGIEIEGADITVTPIGRNRLPAGCTLDCQESGSTLRFMLPLVSALGCGATFTAGGRLPERPLSPLYEQLLEHGMKLGGNGIMPLTAAGALTPGDFTIDAGISSQFTSGLLMALPLLDAGSRIVLSGKRESAPYIDMTVSVLKQFGVSVYESRDTFTVPGNQTFRSPVSVTVEKDWSAAANWLVAGCIGGSIECLGLEWPGSLQGDRRIVELLRSMGARIETGSGVRVLPSRLHGIDADCSDIPDLVPALAVAAATAQGESRLTGIGRLRLKESDRIESVCSMLRSFGIQCSATDDSIHICGGYPHCATACPQGDHRIAMAAAVLATAADGESTIKNVDCTAKSYPDFFRDFRNLGGRTIERK